MNDEHVDRLAGVLRAGASRRGLLGGAAALAVAAPFRVLDRAAIVLAAKPAASAPALVTRLRARPFAQTTVDALIAELAASGIGTYADPSSAQPLTPVSGVPSPVRVLSWQAHNLALEISGGNGRTGAILDTLTPDQSAAGVPPPSYLLAGYAGAAATPGGELARALLADQNLYEPELLRIPALIPLLFASDLAREATQAQARFTLLNAGPHAPAPASRDAAGVCSSIQQFVDSTINAVFSALETEAAKVVNPGGGVLGSVWGWIRAGLDKLKAIAKWVAQQLTAPVVRIIRSIAGVLAIAGQVTAALQPWTVRMTASPDANRFGIDAETVTGTVTARVDTGLIEAWPPDLLDCAQQAGVTLPSFTPKNDPISWSVTETPLPLARSANGPATLDNQAEAVWSYVANDESKEAAQGEAHQGVLRVTARVRRPELEQLKDQFIRLLFAQLPDVIAKIVQPVLGPRIGGLLGQLTGLLASDGVAAVPVTYHTPKPKTPTPTPGKAVGVALKSVGPRGQYFEITAHACAGPVGTWTGVWHAVDQWNDLSLPISWTFAPGGTTAATDIGPTTEVADGVSYTATFHISITLASDAAGAPNALIFQVIEDLAGQGSGAMAAFFTNLGVPIPLTHNPGKVCG